VWADVFAASPPIVLRDVTLGEGDTDLGAYTPETGASLRLHVLVPEGQDAPRIFVSAARVGEPAYTRSLNSRGEHEIVVHGLGPGRFRVRAYLAARPRLDEAIESDGASEIVLTLDLR
jgi:hypothetical protein